jgi:xanthine dehydrogenase YagS FAD-binding subunit
MRAFTHINAQTLNEACTALWKYKGKARLNAGGTDLLSTLKGDNLFDYPEAVINLKTIPDLDYIREEGDVLKIGALARLSDVAKSPLLRKSYRVLAEAANSVGSPQIRNVATMAGNLCQDVRCWYYRYPRHLGGPLGCARKQNGPCLAVGGDNRYHAIMGAKKCFAVCPSDTAVALAVLNAQVVITGLAGERRIGVSEFFSPMGNALERGEMVKEIEVPGLTDPAQQNFLKFTLRRPIDFAILSVASVMTVKKGLCTDARIALGGLAAGPVRAKSAESGIVGRSIDEATAEVAAKEALAGVKPLSQNAYKVEIAKTLVKRALLQSYF